MCSEGFLIERIRCIRPNTALLLVEFVVIEGVSCRITCFLEDDHIHCNETATLQVTACFPSLVLMSNYCPPFRRVPPEKAWPF